MLRARLLRPLIVGTVSLARRATAEAVGTALLLAAVVGSGIMGDRLSGGNVAIALLANSIATGAALVTLILTFGPISGAHFNPAVSVMNAIRGELSTPDASAYLAAQLTGAFMGVACANLMFGEPIVAWSQHVRAGGSQVLSEVVATVGLLTVIGSCARYRREAVPLAVGSYIASAYWFTASTSFANPAVTLARMATNTFAGIRPQDAPGFLTAQAIGVVIAVALLRWLLAPSPARPVAERRVTEKQTEVVA